MSPASLHCRRLASWVVFIFLVFFPLAPCLFARDPDRILPIWPSSAPGEQTRETGHPLPSRAGENPPATRIAGITQPQLHMFAPPPGKAVRAAVLIFPGGGYNYVVADKEGSEAAVWLNDLGVTAFVVFYRTKLPNQPSEEIWRRPWQDGQRAVRLVRSQAEQLNIDPAKIGVLGFSAGGQTAALLATRFDHAAYAAIDGADQSSSRPDFCLFIYPGLLVDSKTGLLSELLPITTGAPPAFLAHAHDDSATSLNSVMYYIGLKQNKVSAELHIYQNGGHGYGARPVLNSDVATWKDRASDWLRRRSLISSSP